MLTGEALVDAFLGYLQRAARAPATSRMYGAVAAELARFAAGRPLQQLSPIDIDGFLASWQRAFVARHGRAPSAATYRSRVNALRALYGWLERFDLLVGPDGSHLPNPMRHVLAPKPEQRRNDWLQTAEDAALLSAEMTETEAATVWLLRWTGVRVSEARSLRVSDIDLTRGRESVTVHTSKTEAGRRVIPVVPELQLQLEAWLRYRVTRDGCHSTSPLLAGRSGRPLSAPYLWRLVKRVAHRADVRPIMCTCERIVRGLHERDCPQTRSGESCSEISPHTLRRTFGSDLLNRGLRLEVVSKLLGHATTAVTERAYAQLLDRTARAEFLAVLQHDLVPVTPHRQLTEHDLFEEPPTIYGWLDVNDAIEMESHHIEPYVVVAA